MEEQLRLDDTAVTWREVDDEVVALRLGDSMYLGVNSSGARLWELLSRGAAAARAAGPRPRARRSRPRP